MAVSSLALVLFLAIPTAPVQTKAPPPPNLSVVLTLEFSQLIVGPK